MAVGKTPQRIDAVDKVTGAATYPADRVPDNALHAVVVFTNQPHARLVDLDFTDTLSAPGVVTVVTAADVPVNEYGLTLFDQPVFIGLDDTGRSSVPCDVSRWEADHLAVVVAENLVQAREASALIKAQWEILMSALRGLMKFLSTPTQRVTPTTSFEFGKEILLRGWN